MGDPVLNVPLQLETPQRQADGMGGFRMAWQVVGHLWAEMKAGTGRETRAEVGPQSLVSWRITVRAAKAGDPRRPRPNSACVWASGCFASMRWPSVTRAGAG